MSSSTPRPPASFTLNQFAIPLGIAGLGGAWAASENAVEASPVVADVLFAIATVLWATFAAGYVLQRFRHSGSFRADLTHPIVGPFAAYVPVIALLLISRYAGFLGDFAPWFAAAFGAALLTVAAQLVGHWIIGDISIDTIHPGYFLPVVAGAFVASIAFSSSGLPEVAIAAFGIGIFFWLVIGTVVTGRLITRGPLPDGVKPTLSVLLAPPAVGGIASLLISGGTANVVGYAFVGITVILLAVQLVLLPNYLRLRPTLSFWAFTFPVAATTNFAIRWWEIEPFPGSVTTTWVAVGLATAAVITVAFVTLAIPAIARGRRRGALR